MPIYEYECESCGHRFEIQQKATDRPLKKCAERNGDTKACGGELKKLFFPAAIIFKGSGWHIKDYAKGSSGGNGGKKSEDAKSEKASSDSDSKSDTKSETKAEATKEPATSKK